MKKGICGVNPSLYKKYEFREHIWFQNQSVRADLLHLAQRCVKIGSIYWMKKVGGESWIALPSVTDAEKEAINTWLGGTLPSGNIVDSELIATFFSGEELQAVGIPPKVSYQKIKVGSCPNIYQKMVVPNGPQFVTYNQQAYVNTWYDDMTYGDPSQLPLGKLILVMIYGGLCGGKVNLTNPSAEAERIYQMILTDDYDNVEFRFLMNWIAAIYQQPGINLQTNVWLIGELQGLGKGTLIDIMRHILGHEFVGELNQTEIEAGWNDHLIGKQLIEVNEFDSTGKMSGPAWGKWLKNHTIEPSFKVRQRNVTSYTVLHIGNFIGTSNSVEQTFIDDNDRRNQFIATASDPFWVQFATSIQLQHFKPNPKGVAAAFAYVLEQVKVDLTFIGKSFKNQLRQNMVSNTLNIIEEWVLHDPTIKQGIWTNAADLYSEYKTWFHINHPSDPIPSIHAFGKTMGKMAAMGSGSGISKQRTMISTQYMFSVPVAASASKLEDAVSVSNNVTGITEQLVVYDLDEPEDKPDFTAMTPLQKMRAQLRKDESKQQEYE